jgi:DNA-binding Lrp family transcriptional regulator
MTGAVDAVDLQLYELLLEDGLRSLSELASIVSISESMAGRCVDALRERGCLRFSTFWNPTCSGMT